MSSKCFEPEAPYHNCIYNCLPDDKPSVSEHVEDIKIKKWNIHLETVHFVSLCCIIGLKYRVKKTQNYYYLCIFELEGKPE